MSIAFPNPKEEALPIAVDLMKAKISKDAVSVNEICDGIKAISAAVEELMVEANKQDN